MVSIGGSVTVASTAIGVRLFALSVSSMFVRSVPKPAVSPLFVDDETVFSFERTVSSSGSVMVSSTGNGEIKDAPNAITVNADEPDCPAISSLPTWLLEVTALPPPISPEVPTILKAKSSFGMVIESSG